ncbi:MAG: NUDIX hydrolase [Oscillospiraceae bacterium]|nr:NUDIX hydrolase [Oscillospiraceae bacterium]
MDMTEKQLSTEQKYKGVIVTVDLDTALSPSGRVVHREVVKHPGGVVVVPIDEEGKIILVRQFRYPFHTVLTELPAGKNEPGEEPAYGAARELSEEVGAEGTLIPLGTLISSPGFCTEVLNLYLGVDLTFGKQHTDPDEFLDLLHITFEEAEEMILSGELCDSKTVAGILKAKLYLEKNPR